MKEGTPVGIGRRTGGTKLPDGGENTGEDGSVTLGMIRQTLEQPAAGEWTEACYGGCHGCENCSAGTVGPAADDLPDTGARSEFSTGAVRDASVGKGHYRSIPPTIIRRLAKRFEDGARKYQDGNWIKGIPLSNYYDSARRHMDDWLVGKTDEDHLAAAIWNLVAGGWTEEQIKNGKLPADLDNLLFRD